MAGFGEVVQIMYVQARIVQFSISIQLIKDVVLHVMSIIQDRVPFMNIIFVRGSSLLR